MSEKRLNNSIFLMHLATEAYMRRHHLSRREFLVLNAREGLIKFIANCPDIFDAMTDEEMADELDAYIDHAA